MFGINLGKNLLAIPAVIVAGLVVFGPWADGWSINPNMRMMIVGIVGGIVFLWSFLSND